MANLLVYRCFWIQWWFVFLVQIISSSSGFKDKSNENLLQEISQELNQMSNSKNLDNTLADINRRNKRKIDEAQEKEFWHSYRFGTGTGNREILRISGVHEEKWMGEGCNGDGVWSWQSMEIGRNQGLLLGLGKESLFLCSYSAPYLAAKQRKEYPAYNATQTSSVVSGFPTAAVMFQTWNDTSKTIDIIAVIALDFNQASPMLVWYRVLQDYGKFVLSQLPTTWPLQRSVWQLLSFKIRKERIIVVLNHPREDRIDTTVDLHGFTWEEEGKTDFWLIQKLTVDEASSIAVVNFEETAFLGISQPYRGIILLYQFDVTQHKFVSFQEIEVVGVSNVVSFHVGFSAFMAVAGDKPMLLRYDKEEFIMEKIEGIEGLGRVLYWLPIPIHTYRDEVVLLAETEAEKKRLVSMVTWTGGHPGFSLHSPTTCHVNGESVEGLWCLLNYYNDDYSSRFGLQSAAALGVGWWTSGLIIPRSSGPSALFRLESYIESVLSPALKEIHQLSKRKEEMEAIIEEQSVIIKKTKEILDDALNIQGSNTISGYWDISELQGEVVKIPNISEDSGVTFLADDDGLSEWQFGGLQWSVGDVQLIEREKLDSLRKYLKEMESNIEEMKNEVNDAVPLYWNADEPIVISAPKTFEGTIVLEGKLVADNLSLDKLNDVPVLEMLTEIVRIDRKRTIGGHKVLGSLYVENLQVTDQLGDISVSSLVFADDDVINIDGNLSYVNELKVLHDVVIPSGGLVNGLDVSEVVIAVNRTYDLELDFVETVTAESILAEKVNNLDINQEYLDSLFQENALGQQVVQSNLVIESLEVLGENLEIKDINGQNLHGFLSNLVDIHNAGYIPGETYIKDCHALAEVQTRFLNGLAFPNDYVLTSGDQIITGVKHFISDYSMQTDVLVLSGFVNGVNTSYLITSYTDQVLHETSLNFESLQVNRVEVIGTMDGMPAIFYKNPPMLGESPVIFSDIFFKDLEVTGDFIVNGLVDGTPWEEMLGGIIYDDEDNIALSSPKFVIQNLVAGSLTLDGLMNGLDVSGFLTTDTEQIFVGKTLIGNDCTVSNMEIENRMMHGVDIVDFFDNSIRLSGEALSIEEMDAEKIAQKIHGSIKFEEEVSIMPSLLAFTINELSATEVAYTNQDQEFTGDIVFEVLHAETVKSDGSLHTEGLVSGVNLTDFDEKRFSLSRSQDIEDTTNVYIHSAFINGDLLVNSVNGVLLEILDGSSLLAPEYDTNKSYDIENLIVNGTMITDRIGKFDMKEITENAVWINKENFIKSPITFEEEVTFENLQVEGTFNGYDLDSFLKDIVRQGEDVEISGHKTFTNGFRVGDIRAVILNGNPLDDILTTNTEQEILGPLTIKGNVIAQGDLKFSSTSKVNGMDSSMYGERYKWRGDMHVIKGDVKLRNSTSIDNLFVYGSVGNVKWEEFINDIVYINDDVEIQGKVSFNNKVVFKSDLSVIEMVDGVNLEHLFGSVGSAWLIDNQGSYKLNAAYVEAGDPVLQFRDDVVIKGGLYVAGDIIADEVYGCSLQEWAEEAIYLDQSMEVQGVKAFQSMSSTSNVIVKFINGIDLEKVILLNGEQSIDQELTFKSLYIPAGSNVYVGNYVNGYNLEEELNNTLLVEGDQIVPGKKTFVNGVKVRGDVRTIGTINNILTENIATLDTEQEFRGSFEGNHLIARGDVRVLGSVNGRDVTQWVDLAVCRDGGRSTITGRWDVLGNVTFLGEDVLGDGTLDGVDVSQLYEMTSLKSYTLKGTMDGMMKNLSGVCEDVQMLGEQVISQAFLFRGLEAVQIIETNYDIKSIYHFSVLEEEYLTVSFDEQCNSLLYVWDHLSTNFVLLGKLRIGPILDWHTLGFIQDDMVIVAKSGGYGRECVNSGYNLWHFVPQEQQIKHFQGLGDFKSVKVLPRGNANNNLLYTIGQGSNVTEWSLSDDGLLMKSRSWNVSGDYLTLVQEKDWEVRIVMEDKKVSKLTGDVSSDLPDIYAIGDYEILSIAEDLMLGAYAVSQETFVEGAGDSIKVFNLNDGSLFTIIPAIKPSSIVAVNFGYKRQKMFAFLEDLLTLRMYEYKGSLGFVEYLSIPVRGVELLALPLKTRNLFSPHNFILAQSARTITVFEAEMYGDPVYGLQDFTCT